MSRFHFRLERVLGVRRIEEDVARAAWLEAENRAQAAEREAQAVGQSLARARAELGELQSHPHLAPTQVLLRQSAIDRLREVWVQRTIHSSRLRREADRLRVERVERRTRVRGLETLETRERQRWRAESEARSNAELDERATRRPHQDSPDADAQTARQARHSS